MPKGTLVDRMFRALKREGKSTVSAARIAQARTGKSLQTGRRPKTVVGRRRDASR